MATDPRPSTAPSPILTPGATEARDRIRGRVAGALMNAKPDWFDGAERAAVEHLQSGYDVTHHAASAADHAAIVPDSLVDR